MQQDSMFRQSFNFLQSQPGRRIQWPQLLRKIFDEEIDRLRLEGVPYASEVFIDRDEKALEHEDHPKSHLERVMAQRLYREAHRHNEGLVRVGDEPVLLISFEVPNQGNERGRRADLLGLKLSGALVLFECKPEGNPSTPLHAILEGLDYLGHLLIKSNMEKLAIGFTKWRDKRRDESVLSRIPSEFRQVEIEPTARHDVVVLAPENYFAEHWTDSAKQENGWHLLADRKWTNLPAATGIEFATTDFTSSDCPLFNL